MTLALPEHFAMQSMVEVRSEPVGGGSIAMLATIGRPGRVRVTGLKPHRRYLLAGAACPCVRSDSAGEAVVAVAPGGRGVVTLVPVV